jgi:hypothetical protein
MSVERTYYCDGPPDPDSDEDRCLTHASTASPPPYLPRGIIEVREVCDQSIEPLHFCSWDCLMKYAAAQPIPVRIEMDGP